MKLAVLVAAVRVSPGIHLPYQRVTSATSSAIATGNNEIYRINQWSSDGIARNSGAGGGGRPLGFSKTGAKQLHCQGVLIGLGHHI